jgi:hypothetical protein
MALATAPERVTVAAPPRPVPESDRRSRPAVASPGRRGPRWSLRRAAVLSGALVLCSLLMVVTASAYLTQGQVRLTRMQQQLTSELGRHRDLEARVAQLADPNNVVSQAQHHGLTAPSQVTDIPQVNPSPASVATSTAPTSGHTSVQPTAGR